MPTFTNPLDDAREAAEALRGLAHASRVFDRPETMYDVLGELLAGVRSLEQVLDQLAAEHSADRGLAFDDYGNSEAGRAAARTAAAELRQAAALAGQAERRLDAATSAAGRILWHPSEVQAASQQHINVVFLQGEDADRIIEQITLRGANATIEELAAHDMGAETVQAALENGYVYDEPPVGQLDKTAPRDAYTLVYNPFMGRVGLYREHDAAPDPVLIGVQDPPAHARTAETAPPAGAVAAPEAPGRSRRDRLGTPTITRPTTSRYKNGRDLSA